MLYSRIVFASLHMMARNLSGLALILYVNFVNNFEGANELISAFILVSFLNVISSNGAAISLPRTTSFSKLNNLIGVIVSYELVFKTFFCFCLTVFYFLSQTDLILFMVILYIGDIFFEATLIKYDLEQKFLNLFLLELPSLICRLSLLSLDYFTEFDSAKLIFFYVLSQLPRAGLLFLVYVNHIKFRFLLIRAGLFLHFSALKINSSSLVSEFSDRLFVVFGSSFIDVAFFELVKRILSTLKIFAKLLKKLFFKAQVDYFNLIKFREFSDRKTPVFVIHTLIFGLASSLVLFSFQIFGGVRLEELRSYIYISIIIYNLQVFYLFATNYAVVIKRANIMALAYWVRELLILCGVGLTFLVSNKLNLESIIILKFISIVLSLFLLFKLLKPYGIYQALPVYTLGICVGLILLSLTVIVQAS